MTKENSQGVPEVHRGGAQPQGDVVVIEFVYKAGSFRTVDRVVLHPDGRWRMIQKGPQLDSRTGNVGRMWRRADGSDV